MVIVQSFRRLGRAGLVLSLIKIIIFAFSKVSIFWPISLLILGFILILIAISLRTTSYRAVLESLWASPSQSAFGLGEQPAKEISVPLSRKLVARRAGLVIIIMIVIYLLLTLISG